MVLDDAIVDTGASEIVSWRETGAVGWFTAEEELRPVEASQYYH